MFCFFFFASRRVDVANTSVKADTGPIMMYQLEPVVFCGVDKKSHAYLSTHLLAH